MATVTGYTAEKMKEIEDKAITGGAVVSGDLILYPNNYPTESSVNAGPVVGPAGPTGPAGAVSDQDLEDGLTDLEAELRLPLGVMNRGPSAYQALADGVHTAIAFNVEDAWDNGGFHSPTTNNSRFTVPAGGAGIYFVTYNGYFNSSVNGVYGTRYIAIYKNNSSVANQSGRIAAQQVDYGSGTTHVSMTITDHFRLAVGDYLVPGAYHFTGATNQAFTANFCMRWVSL